jgi:hypothetical protein
MPEGRLKASSEGLDGEFRAGLWEVSVRNGLAVRLERGRQGCFGLRETFAAAGAHPKFTGEIAQTGGSALHRGPDMSLGNRFADAYDHVAIVNANANDCQCRSK